MNRLCGTMSWLGCLLVIGSILSGSLLAESLNSVFPQLAVGGGFTCDFFITNQGSETADGVRLEFFGDDGDSLRVETGFGIQSRVTFNLDGGETRLVQIGLPNGPATAGYAVLTFPDRTSVRGTLVIRFQSSGRTLTQVGLSQQFAGTDFTFAVEVDSARNINTGLALANVRLSQPFKPVPQDQGFVLTLVNADGTVRDQAILQLGSGEHASLFLNDQRLFPNLDGFVGSASVSAGVDFGLLALRLDQGILASQAIDPGPNLADLTRNLPSREAAEVEGNDSVDSAQKVDLPIRIRGGIETPADADLFQFEATAGSVVTLFVVTEDDSFLDAYMTVEGLDGTLLSVSDQNGLIGRSDSFIRFVVPRSSTYIVRLEDFFFSGGEGFDYWLLGGIE